MPRLVITEGASQGLERCRSFLSSQNLYVLVRAGKVIEKNLALLEVEPAIGRPLNDIPELRELIIPFGDSGYIALYRYEERADAVYVLAFRHQKEAGYA